MTSLRLAIVSFALAFLRLYGTETNSASTPMPPANVTLPAAPTYTQPGEQLIASSEKILYKKTPQTELHMYILRPAGPRSAKPLPAIVYFAGGGWVIQSAAAQIPVAAWFRDHGIIAITADYRVKQDHGTTPLECIADAKSAIRYVRAHAKGWGIDPHRIIAAGGSAGGHIAACTALPGGDEPGEDLTISSRGDALVLHNPGVGEGFGAEFFAVHPEFSPIIGVRAGWPPTILSCGTDDAVTLYSGAEKFTRLMRQAGNTCELITVKGAPHSCDWPVTNPNFLPTLTRMTAFLREQGMIP